MDDVEYRTLPDLPGYKIFRNGDIRGPSGKILRGSVTPAGYLQIGGPKKDGKRRSYAVHVTVCRAFHGEKPDPRMYVCHGVGTSKLDNRAENLRWDYPSANQADRIADGTDNGAQRNGQAKLTNQQVKDIRASDESQGVLAARYNVSRATICRILQRKTWTRVE